MGRSVGTQTPLTGTKHMAARAVTDLPCHHDFHLPVLTRRQPLAATAPVCTPRHWHWPPRCVISGWSSMVSRLVYSSLTNSGGKLRLLLAPELASKCESTYRRLGNG
jgi:hypothetical protein